MHLALRYVGALQLCMSVGSNNIYSLLTKIYAIFIQTSSKLADLFWYLTGRLEFLFVCSNSIFLQQKYIRYQQQNMMKTNQVPVYINVK